MTELKLSEWCNYRTKITKIQLANRGADEGFSLYFDADQEPDEPDRRTLGLRLTWEQVNALRRLIDEGLSNYNRDNRQTSGGTYSYPPEGEEQNNPTPSQREYVFVKNPEFGVIKAQQPCIMRLFHELVNVYDSSLPQVGSEQEAKRRLKSVCWNWINDLMAKGPDK